MATVGDCQIGWIVHADNALELSKLDRPGRLLLLLLLDQLRLLLGLEVRIFDVAFDIHQIYDCGWILGALL